MEDEREAEQRQAVLADVILDQAAPATDARTWSSPAQKNHPAHLNPNLSAEVCATRMAIVSRHKALGSFVTQQLLTDTSSRVKCVSGGVVAQWNNTQRGE